MNRSSTIAVADSLCNEAAPPQTGVRPIGLADLKARIASEDDPLLVMAMDQRRFDTAHIDGSISFDSLLADLATLNRSREVVVYCTGPQCAASKLRAAFLVDSGFTNVSRFAGGLAEWSEAGLPLEGTQAG